MLDACTAFEQNALVLAQERDKDKQVFRAMMRCLDNKSLAQDKTKRDMWLGILAIARNMMEHES